MSSIETKLAAIRDRGVSLWVAQGELRYRAAKGSLSSQDIHWLKTYKQPLLDLLARSESEDSATQTNAPSATHEPVPLSFAQLAHWNLYRLYERRSIRQVASATRMDGLLSVEALQHAIERVVHRQDALRTRIVVRDDVPMQVVAASVQHELDVIDLTDVPVSRHDAEVQKHIQRFILKSISLAEDPLFGFRLLRLGPQEHILVVTMEHIISDGYSLNVIEREVFGAYMNIVCAAPVTLPRIGVRLADYAKSQRRADDAWRARHASYWRDRLSDCGRQRFPQSELQDSGRILERGTVTVRIPNNVKQALMEWSRVRGTTLVMTMLTAYAALVLRWCATRDTVLQYYSNGRTTPDLENTIGYFASPFYLRIVSLPQDTFGDLLRRVVDEYCQACDHADCARFGAETPRSPFVANTAFNWLPMSARKPELEALHGTEHAMTLTPVRLTYPAPADFEVDREPFMLLSDLEQEIVAEIYFQRPRFDVASLQKFGRNFVSIIDALLSRPDASIENLELES